MEINVTFVLILTTVATSMYAWNNPAVQSKWMFNPYSIYHKRQFFRFLSSGFIHSNYTHLIFNMIALYFFGAVIEQIYGQLFGAWGVFLYLTTYLVGIVVANLKTYFDFKDQSFYNSLGASGGVAAIIFASILYRPTSSICLYFMICIPAFILGVGYLIYSYYSGKRSGDNINHDAHLYGSLFGIAFTIFLRPVVVMEFIEGIKDFDLSNFLSLGF